uniref:Uncharacterized protein n=1 Tax=uncultured bacterium A1Q1_fos_962 TaxID=1256592 RepID=L7VX36_9BACT|nr:hypothetical protein [uncultured bacterium A1Q1_fos_962]
MWPTGLRILLTYLTVLLTHATAIAQTSSAMPSRATEGSLEVSSASHITTGQVGLDGIYKLGQWTQVRIRLASPPSDSSVAFVLYVQDSEGVPVAYSGSATGDTVDFLIKLGRADSPVEMVAKKGQETLWREMIPAQIWPAPIPSAQQTVVNLGSDLVLSAAMGMRSANGRERIVTQHVTDPNALPTHWLGYSSVDVLALPTGDRRWLDQMDVDQWRALQRWVEQGGYLFVSGAINFDLFQDSGRLTWCTESKIAGTLKIRQTTGIEQFIGATSRLDQNRNSNNQVFEVAMLDIQEPQGRVEVWEGLVNQRRPAVVRSVVGLGRVTLVGLDVDRAPFLDWNDRPKLMAQLLEPGLDEPLDETLFGVESGPVAHLGYTDVVGQLRRALDQFSQVQFVPFSWIAALILVYLVAIGPLDFWILRRLRRPHWTWRSSPVIVLAFVGLMWWAAMSSKGNQLRVNQLSVIDVDIVGGIVRGTSWHHLFSPRSDRFDIELHSTPALASQANGSSVLSWQGLPGKGFGGLERTESLTVSTTPYGIDFATAPREQNTGAIRKLPLAIWSSRSLVGQWWGQTELKSEQTQLRLGSESLVRGIVHNPLPIELRDAVLIYDHWAYPLGNLPANGIKPIDELQQFDLQDLQTYLTNRRVVDGRSVTDPWDQQSSDIFRIAQLMFFYQAAEGQGYARLQHRYQRTLDWSDHVRLNRAVLLGRANVPGCQLKIDQQEVPADKNVTCCRILLPVQSEGGPSS